VTRGVTGCGGVYTSAHAGASFVFHPLRVVTRIDRWFPWWPELRRPGTLRIDLLAGLTGAVVVLPQGLAFALLAGMPPEYGLYSAMVPCLIAALCGSSRQMVTGPANAISLTTLALVAPLATPGTPEYIQLVLTLTFMVGVMQLVLGMARAGALVDHVPHAVIIGFTSGAAILIANSQLPAFFGIDLPLGASIRQQVTAIVANAERIQPMTVLAGLVTVVAIRLWMPLNRKVPAMLVGVVVGALCVFVLRLAWPSLPALPVVEALPLALPPLSAPDLSPGTLQALLLASLVMTLLALTEATAIARAMASRERIRLDGNREFVGQGLANVAGSFFSAYPASGSFNRSGVNYVSGARTPIAAASAALFLMLLLPVVGPLVRHLPLAVIAGLLFVVAWGLVDRGEILRVWRDERQDRLTMAVTFIATVTIALQWAILLGLFVGLASRFLTRGQRL
jgi:sulfate permease, SulP family